MLNGYKSVTYDEGVPDFDNKRLRYIGGILYFTSNRITYELRP